jgi:hypothetical protein
LFAVAVKRKPGKEELRAPAAALVAIPFGGRWGRFRFYDNGRGDLKIIERTEEVFYGIVTLALYLASIKATYIVLHETHNLGLGCVRPFPGNSHWATGK